MHGIEMVMSSLAKLNCVYAIRAKNRLHTFHAPLIGFRPHQDEAAT